MQYKKGGDWILASPKNLQHTCFATPNITQQLPLRVREVPLLVSLGCQARCCLAKALVRIPSLGKSQEHHMVIQGAGL